MEVANIYKPRFIPEGIVFNAPTFTTSRLYSSTTVSQGREIKSTSMLVQVIAVQGASELISLGTQIFCYSMLFPVTWKAL